MKKKLGKFFLVLSATAFPLLASANIADVGVQLQLMDPQLVYHQDFDIVALQFDVTVAQDKFETLQTLVIQKAGSAQSFQEYKNPKLWIDKGDEGFQGYGYDEVLPVSSIEDNIVNVVFDKINKPVKGTTKFFVTVDSRELPQERSMQFTVPAANDKNFDGKWQTGESGIYFSNAVYTEALSPSSSTSLLFKKQLADYYGPRGYISNLDPNALNDFTAPSNPLVFSGMAKDRNGGTVKKVVVVLKDKDLTETRLDANFVSSNEVSWTANFTAPLGIHDYTVHLEMTDSSSLTTLSGSYRISVDNRLPDKEKSSLVSSKSAIEATGADSTLLTLTVKDSTGNALSNRAIQFLASREQDILTLQSAETDENGRIVLGMTSTKLGLSTITASYAGQQLAFATVDVVQTIVEPAPTQPTPEPQQPTEPNHKPEDYGLSTGDLIKGSLSGVYYLDEKGIRHVFVTQSIYESWYGNDFTKVKTISDTLLAQISLGAPVTFKPGKLITTPSINEVYLVTKNKTLRHIASETVAKELLGDNWNKMIHDTSDALLFSYSFGDPITEEDIVSINDQLSTSLTITSEFNS